jgi:hypothetical protein
MTSFGYLRYGLTRSPKQLLDSLCLLTFYIMSQFITLSTLLFVATFTYVCGKIHSHRRQYFDLPQLKQSVVLGHLGALNQFITSGEPQRHIGTRIQFPIPPRINLFSFFLFFFPTRH